MFTSALQLASCDARKSFKKRRAIQYHVCISHGLRATKQSLRFAPVLSDFPARHIFLFLISRLPVLFRSTIIKGFFIFLLDVTSVTVTLLVDHTVCIWLFHCSLNRAN